MTRAAERAAVVEEGGLVPLSLDDHIPVRCNVDDQGIFANVRRAVALGLPWLQVNKPNDRTAILVGGGPSMGPYVDLIRQRQKQGAVVFAMNGTLKWLDERGIKANYMVVLDARPDSVDFVSPKVEGVSYLLASQCDPSVFKSVEGEEVTLWHPNYPGIQEVIGDRECALIGGGTTVGLQSMAIAYALGFRRLQLYGYDSSYSDNSHHAYKQALNDSDVPEEVTVQGRKFLSAPWMIRQAGEYQQTVAQLVRGDAEIQVFGDGLLPWIAKCMMQPPGDTACYDLASAPASFDFLVWLVNAEMNRRERGFPAPLRVAFKPGPLNGFRHDALPMNSRERQGMLDNVLRPALKLVGAVEDDSAIEGCQYPYTYRSVVDAARNGVSVPLFKARPDDLREVDEYLKGRNPVVIVLREAKHWPHRNSNLDAWIQFAKTLDDVIFVRDTAKADEPMEFETCPRASKDLCFRAALHERAMVVMGVGNGPMVLCVNSPAPYIMFKQIAEGHSYAAATPQWFEKVIGVPVGSQYPWATPKQVMAWCDDTPWNISRVFREWNAAT